MLQRGKNATAATHAAAGTGYRKIRQRATSSLISQPRQGVNNNFQMKTSKFKRAKIFKTRAGTVFPLGHHQNSAANLGGGQKESICQWVVLPIKVHPILSGSSGRSQLSS